MDAQTEQLWQQAAALRVDATGRRLDAGDAALDLLGVLRVTHERLFKRARG